MIATKSRCLSLADCDLDDIRKDHFSKFCEVFNKMNEIDNSVTILEKAQRLHDEFVQEGHDKAESLISDAHNEAERIIAEAKEKVKDLEDKAKEVTLDIESLRDLEEKYRSSLVRLAEQTIAFLGVDEDLEENSDNSGNLPEGDENHSFTENVGISENGDNSEISENDDIHPEQSELLEVVEDGSIVINESAECGPLPS